MQSAQSSFPKHGLVFSIRACLSGSGSHVMDIESGVEIGGAVIIESGGHTCWDLDETYLERSGGASLTEGPHYTHAVWVQWRASESGCLTLMAAAPQGQSIVVDAAGKRLGMFYEADGEFSDCGYEISSDMSGWQLVVVTGSADSPDSITGTSTFYLGAEGASSMTLCGTVDKVVSGNNWYRLGWPGQGPGKVAAAYEWNRILSKAELDQLLRAGVEEEHADRASDTRLREELKELQQEWSEFQLERYFVQGAQSSFPKHGLVFSIRACLSDSGSKIMDIESGVEIGGAAIIESDGHACWDLDTTYLERSGGASLTEGPNCHH
eukprot:TRINITY_DN6741_c0_g1_i12.p1 TRINITY_DN6741_c0_g1~~TRINITY_DN6741_c0_g1_i12.p1  ORF type:complete len:323 (+),score=50.27 TRINITY_DN6741_c0_g1_i12:541-1509(+)